MIFDIFSSIPMSPEERIDESAGWHFLERFTVRSFMIWVPFFVIWEVSSGVHRLRLENLLFLGEAVSLLICLVFDVFFQKIRQHFWRRHPLRNEEGIDGDSVKWYLWVQPLVWTGFMIHALVLGKEPVTLIEYIPILLLAGFVECALRVNSIWIIDRQGVIRRLWVTAVGVVELGEVSLKSTYLDRELLYDQNANDPTQDSGTHPGTLIGLTATIYIPEIRAQKIFKYGPIFFPHKHGKPDSQAADLALEQMIESSEAFHALGIPYRK